MEQAHALQTMSALSRATRFDVMRKLVDAGPGGMSAGQLSEATGSTPSAMTAHLAILARVGLVLGEKRGKFVNYQALPQAIDELMAFLDRALPRP